MGATETETTTASPPRALIEPDARRRGMAISVGEGMSAQIHSALTGLGVSGNAITFGFAMLLGASDISLGICAAIPPLASTAQLVAPWLGPKLRARKGAVALMSTIARCSWLAVAALPFVVARTDVALALFLALWAIGCALLSFSGNLWISWMADLVPPRVRARYFSFRTNACNVAGILVGLGAGLVLDRWFGGVPRASQAVTVLAGDDLLRARGFAVLFSLAAFFGVTCFALLRRQPEPERVAPPAPRESGIHGLLIAPFAEASRTPGLRGLLLFVALFGFTNGFAQPYWTPFQLRSLGMDYSTVSGLLVVLGGAAQMIALPFWGRFTSRFGHRTTVAIAVCIIATHPLYYLIATPDRTWPMLCDAVSSGIAWGGYNVAIQNLALQIFGLDARRDRFFAVYIAIAGLAQAVSSIVLSSIATLAIPACVTLGGVALDRYQLIFLGTSLARAACLLVFLRAVPAPAGVVPIRAVLAALPYHVKARMEGFKFLRDDQR